MSQQQIAIRVDEELYTNYKIALLKLSHRNGKRQNVTQDLITHMKKVIAIAEKEDV